MSVLLIYGLFLLCICQTGNAQTYFLSGSGREMTHYDIFRSLGSYIDHFEIIMNYLERQIEHEVKYRPTGGKGQDYVDFIVKHRRASIKRGPLSKTYMNHISKQSISLRNQILQRTFRKRQKYSVTRLENDVRKLQNTLENTYEDPVLATQLK